MRPRTLLILLALVLGLGAFIWFYERDLPSSEERAEQARKVLSLEKDDIQAVTLHFQDKQVSLERLAGPEPVAEKAEEAEEEEGEEGTEEPPAPVSVEWRMTRPMTARADTFAVDGLLEALTGLEKTRTLEDVKPADVGLDKPQAIVRLRLKEGEKVLRIGAAVPTGGAVIAQVDGEDGAYVVSDSILEELRREPGTWRDRRLVLADKDTVQSIRLSAGGQTLALVKKGPGFRIEGPLADRADREKVDELFTDLSGLSAEEFVDRPDRPLADLGLQPPQAVAQVTVQDRSPVRIEVGAPVEQEPATPEPDALGGQEGEEAVLRWARVDGQLVQTRTRLADLAVRPPAEWRSAVLSSFEVHQIDSVAVEEPGQAKIQLTRAGTDWKRGEETISYVPVSDLLFALTEARADRLLAPAETQAAGLQLARPALTFQLQGKDLGAETVDLYPGTGQGVPARVSGRDAILMLPAGKLQEVRDRLKAVREAKPLSEEEGGE